jgi:hypothetical protein
MYTYVVCVVYCRNNNWKQRRKIVKDNRLGYMMEIIDRWLIIYVYGKDRCEVSKMKDNIRYDKKNSYQE